MDPTKWWAKWKTWNSRVVSRCFNSTRPWLGGGRKSSRQKWRIYLSCGCGPLPCNSDHQYYLGNPNLTFILNWHPGANTWIIMFNFRLVKYLTEIKESAGDWTQDLMESPNNRKLPDSQVPVKSRKPLNGESLTFSKHRISDLVQSLWIPIYLLGFWSIFYTNKTPTNKTIQNKQRLKLPTKTCRKITPGGWHQKTKTPTSGAEKGAKAASSSAFGGWETGPHL